MPAPTCRSTLPAPLLAATGVALAFLAGCASQVEVEATIPTPLVEPFPVSVGLLLDEALHMGGEVASQEERALFNNYGGTKKQLKFDNVSSCSLMLSKSGASSTVKDQVVRKFKKSTQR